MIREEITKEAQEQVNYCTPLHPEDFIHGYIAGAEPRENKIADLKANCDLAIEGRDVKIKELELELTVEKDQHQEEINLHLHAEEYNKSLEEENNKLLDVINNQDVKIADLEKENAELVKTAETFQATAYKSSVLLTKAKGVIRQFLNDYPVITKEILDKLEQFIKEIEK